MHYINNNDQRNFTPTHLRQLITRMNNSAIVIDT